MIRTLDRYVAREFMRLFLLFSFGVPLLFILGDWTERIDRYARDQIPTLRVALGYLYQMPTFISYSLPVAALIATVFTVNNMTRHSEMIAAKAGGVSFFRALAILPVLGVLLTIVGIGVTELVPIGTRAKKEVLHEVERTPDLMRHDFVYAGPRGHIYSIRQLNMMGPSMGQITIEEPGPENIPSLRISAAEATYDSTGWSLHNGILRRFDTGSGGEQAFRFRTMRLAALTETPEQLLARAKDPDEMRYTELGTFIEALERSGATPRKMMVERAQKIAIPAAIMVIILFGAPLANSSARGGAAYGIGISLGITVFYMMLFKLTGAAGIAGIMDPTLAAWIPNIIFFFAAIVLLLRVKT